MRSSTLLAVLGAVGAALLAVPLLAGTGGDGARTTAYSDGSPRERVAWVDGERHGPCTRWNRDGSLREEGTFERGARVGEWTVYEGGAARTVRYGG